MSYQFDVYRAEVKGRGAVMLGKYDFPNHPSLVAQINCMGIRGGSIVFNKPDTNVDYRESRISFKEFFGDDLVVYLENSSEKFKMLEIIHSKQFCRYGWDSIQTFKWFVKNVAPFNSEIELVKYSLIPGTYFKLPDGQVIFKGHPERTTLSLREVMCCNDTPPFHNGDVYNTYVVQG